MRPRRIRRGDVVVDAGLSADGPASMRPRRIRRGDCRHYPQTAARNPGFNAATPNSAWRRYATACLVAEMVRASMRPRRIRRGDMVLTEVQQKKHDRASMRPRRI